MRLVALDGGVIDDRRRRRRRSGGWPTIHARSERRCIDEHQPDAVALEDLYFGQNARSAFAVGQARGRRDARRRPARRSPCAAYTPQQVKRRGVRHRPRRQGPGGADGRRRCSACPTPPLPDHAADALAVAICHANHAPLAAAAAVAG